MKINKWILAACLAAVSLLLFLFVYLQYVDVPVSAFFGTKKSDQKKSKTNGLKPVTAGDFIANSEKGLPEQLVRTIHLDSALEEPIFLKTSVIPESGGGDGSQVALKVLEVKAEDEISREAKGKILGISISVLNISKKPIKGSQEATNAELMLTPRGEGFFGFALKELDSQSE